MGRRDLAAVPSWRLAPARWALALLLLALLAALSAGEGAQHPLAHEAPAEDLWAWLDAHPVSDQALSRALLPQAQPRVSDATPAHPAATFFSFLETASTKTSTQKHASTQEHAALHSKRLKLLAAKLHRLSPALRASLLVQIRTHPHAADSRAEIRYMRERAAAKRLAPVAHSASPAHSEDLLVGKPIASEELSLATVEDSASEAVQLVTTDVFNDDKTRVHMSYFGFGLIALGACTLGAICSFLLARVCCKGDASDDLDPSPM